MAHFEQEVGAIENQAVDFIDSSFKSLRSAQVRRPLVFLRSFLCSSLQLC